MTAAEQARPALQPGWVTREYQAAAELAQAIADALRAAIDERGQALLAVSGGKSPLALFAALREQELAWERVTVLLADERCVPSDHADSNSALVRDHLLQGRAAAASWQPFFGPLPGGDSAGWSEAELAALADGANAALAALPWPLDVLVLGMGEDGHTASLFPASPGLETALHSSARVAWVRPVAAAHARLTLTLPTLLEAGAVFLPLAGAAKLAVFSRASQGPQAELPISLVLHGARHPVQVWLAP